MQQIISTRNPKIKEIIKLRKANKRKKNDIFIIEGRKENKMALVGGMGIKEFYYCPEMNHGDEPPKEFSKHLTLLTAKIFKKISYRTNPDGWLALATPRRTKLSGIKLSDNPLLIILEAIEKPGNLGAVLRTADAAGADAVLICGSGTDIYNPNVIRASRGAVFTVQSASDTNKNIVTWLKKKKIRTYAAAPKANEFYVKQNYTNPTAIIIGSEHTGLSNFWLKRADALIKIPMQGKIDSLNASLSAAVIIYEVLRQRK